MSQPHRAHKPSKVIGLSCADLVSLDVNCSRVSVWDLLSAAWPSQAPITSQHPVQHCRALQLRGIDGPLPSACTGTSSESVLPKPWSELIRNWSSPDSFSFGQAVGRAPQLAPLCPCLCNSCVLDGWCKVLQHPSKEHQQQNIDAALELIAVEGQEWCYWC